MITVLSETQPIASKKYSCDACYNFIDSGISKEDMDKADYEITRAAKKDGWAILHGMRYRKAVYIDNGILHTYRGRLDMDAICTKYELFNDV